MKTKTILITLLSLVTITTLTACNSGSPAQQSTTAQQLTTDSANKMVSGDVSFESGIIDTDMGHNKDFDNKKYTLTNIAFNLNNEKIKIDNAKVNFTAKQARHEDIEISTKLTNKNARDLLSMVHTFNNDKALTEMDLLLENSDGYIEHQTRGIKLLKSQQYFPTLMVQENQFQQNVSIVNYIAESIRDSSQESFYVLPLKGANGVHWVTVLIHVKSPESADFFVIDSTTPFTNVSGVIEKMKYKDIIENNSAILFMMYQGLSKAGFDIINNIDKESVQVWGLFSDEDFRGIGGRAAMGDAFGDGNFYPGWLLQYGEKGCGITASNLINELMKDPRSYTKHILSESQVVELANSGHDPKYPDNYQKTIKRSSIFAETARRIQAAYIIERFEK